MPRIISCEKSSAKKITRVKHEIAVDSPGDLNHYRNMINQIKPIAAALMVVCFHWKRARLPFDYSLM